MPVFDYGRFVFGGIKLALFVTFATLFFTLLNNTSSIISVFIDGALSSISSISSLDLGCFMDGLGGVSFLNSLINQAYIVGGLLVSAVGSILTTKYILMFFGFLMRV